MTEISLAFDIIVTILLAVMIFYAIRLSRHLDGFRANRADMEQLIRELSNQIIRAQEGITALDDLASNKGDELRKYIGRAQELSDELQLITGSADSLAGRLETLATRNRAIVDEMEHTAVDLVYPGQQKMTPKAAELRASPSLSSPSAKAAKFEDTLPRKEKKSEPESGGFFSIRDPDFEADEEKGNDSDDEFMSQAERDLADALRRHAKKS